MGLSPLIIAAALLVRSKSGLQAPQIPEQGLRRTYSSCLYSHAGAVAENAIILTQSRPTYCVTAWMASLETGSNSRRLAEVLDTTLAHTRNTVHKREQSTFTTLAVEVSAGPMERI